MKVNPDGFCHWLDEGDEVFYLNDFPKTVTVDDNCMVLLTFKNTVGDLAGSFVNEDAFQKMEFVHKYEMVGFIDQKRKA